jgi:maltodextrin utilization protein YvdJ
MIWLPKSPRLAKLVNFGKGGGFTVGLLLLPGIFHCILGFGSAQYLEPDEQKHVL